MSHSASYIFTLLMVSLAKKGPQYRLIYHIFHYGYHFCIMFKKSLNIAIKYSFPLKNFISLFYHTLGLWSIWILCTLCNGNPNFLFLYLYPINQSWFIEKVILSLLQGNIPSVIFILHYPLVYLAILKSTPNNLN